MIQVTITGHTKSIEGLIAALGNVSLWLESLNSSDFNLLQLDTGAVDCKHVSAGESALSVVLEKQSEPQTESADAKYVVCWKSEDGSDDDGSGEILLSLAAARDVVAGMTQTCPHLKIWVDDAHRHPDAVALSPSPTPAK